MIADYHSADITFSTVYEPPREKYDFPLELVTMG